MTWFFLAVLRIQGFRPGFRYHVAIEPKGVSSAFFLKRLFARGKVYEARGSGSRLLTIGSSPSPQISSPITSTIIKARSEQWREKCHLLRHEFPTRVEHKTKASVRDLARRELEPLNRTVAEPLSITKLSDFVDRVYLPFAKQHKRPSTYRGYKQVWSDYLELRCKAEWLREVKTHHVQLWLEDIAQEHEQDHAEAYEELPQWRFSTCGTTGLFRRSKPSEARRDSSFCPKRRRDQALLARRDWAMLKVLKKPSATAGQPLSTRDSA